MAVPRCTSLKSPLLDAPYCRILLVPLDTVGGLAPELSAIPEPLPVIGHAVDFLAVKIRDSILCVDGSQRRVHSIPLHVLVELCVFGLKRRTLLFVLESPEEVANDGRDKVGTESGSKGGANGDNGRIQAKDWL